MSTRAATIAATVLLAASAAPAAAQSPATIQSPPLPMFGALAGISIPLGDLAHSQQPGFNIGGLAEYMAPGEALGVRAEVVFEQFTHKQSVAVSSISGTMVTLNAIYHIPGYAFRPYVIGGMGLYHISDDGNHPGINVGMGIDIPLTGLTAHLETRIHHALATSGQGYTTLPISFGVKF